MQDLLTTGKNIELKAAPFRATEDFLERLNALEGALVHELGSPLKLTPDDADGKPELRFYGKGSHRNHGCHYTTVVPYDEAPHADYRPPKPGNDHLYDELVVFQEDQILPQFIVTLDLKGAQPESLEPSESGEDAADESAEHQDPGDGVPRDADGYPADIEQWGVADVVRKLESL
eukprot:gene8983-2957_t